MKKLFLIGALFCASAGILASVTYKTTCGKCFVATGPEGYNGNYDEFLMDMNWYYCHEVGLPFEYCPDAGELPIINP